jgi:hypothetical protein
MRRFAPTALILAALAGLPLAACQNQPKAPTLTGVCYQTIFLKGGGVKFNKLSDHEPTIEACAASLEGMRLRFQTMGGAEEIVGAYQGNYIFLFHTGIFRADSLTGARYLMLVRYDGKLLAPGSLPPEAYQGASGQAAK